MRSSLIRITLVTFLFVFFISGQLQAQKKSDGRFIAYDNGTVLDTKNGLMWAAKDNGSNIDWADAKSYCENYRGGGYTDWRMPMQDELAGLYDSSKDGYRPDCCSDDCSPYIKTTELIHLSCMHLWASETRGDAGAGFFFDVGDRYWGLQLNDFNSRALPVRFGK